MYRSIHAFFISLALFTAGNASAQGETVSGGTRMTMEQIQARADSLRARNYPPATAEGLPAAEFAEYEAIIERHKPTPDAPFASYAGLITAAEQERLLALFRRMSRAQQLAQKVVFIRPDEPRPQRALSENEFESFKDSTQYRVFIDFKPVDGATLATYTALDIWWYQVNASMVKQAGSAFFTRDVRLQTRAAHDRDAARYAQYKDTYQMVLVSTKLRSERVGRPAN
ncbi:hypothetical protein [Flaviaesturariibacter terrae]